MLFRSPRAPRRSGGRQGEGKQRNRPRIGAASAAARRRRRISEPLWFLLPDLAGGLELPLDKERLDQLIQEGRDADEDADDSLH